MVKEVSLIGELQSIAGAGLAEEGPACTAFAVDGLTPRAVVRPSTYQGVAEVLRYGNTNRLTVISWGAGSMMQTGNRPSKYDIALSVAGLTGIVEYEPADLTVTCRAGEPLVALQEQLRRSRQMLPSGPFASREATVGGIVATAGASASRHAYGTPRDFTIGMQVVTADGRITRTGGKVVKNVAGYDLCKLYTGSRGTLGVIVELTFKLAPQPRHEQREALAFDDAATACAFARELERQGMSVKAFTLLNRAATGLPRGGYVLAVDLAGTQAAVNRCWETLSTLAGAAQQLSEAEAERYAGAEAELQTAASVTLECEITVLPSDLPVLIERLGETLEPGIVAYPTIGLARAFWTAGDAEAILTDLTAAFRKIGGSMLVRRCPPSLKSRIDVFGEVPPSFPLMQRLKREFDPNGTLSPGRFVGRL
ncbi:MAG: FAD-binding oxidoreductase [Chloroflexi bacterium]|nr:MAG: FAD-binding oxidoreductase [Chloroflexota bacterium]